MNTEDKLWNCYNGLLISEDISRIRKLIARYELFKLSLEIPGDIIECGVFKGAGLFYWLKLLEIFSNGSSKKIIGFDTFKSFSNDLEGYEKNSADAYVKESSFSGTSIEDISSILTKMGLEDKVELVEGEVSNSLEKYCNNNKGFRISLLNLDFDTYSGTYQALNLLYEKVVNGGIIILDEYAARGWGESDAVDTFFKDKGEKIRCLDYANSPTAYIIKGS